MLNSIGQVSYNTLLAQCAYQNLAAQQQSAFALTASRGHFFLGMHREPDIKMAFDAYIEKCRRTIEIDMK